MLAIHKRINIIPLDVFDIKISLSLLKQDYVEQLSESASQNFSTPTNLKTFVIIDEDKDESHQSLAAQMSTTKTVSRIKIEKLDQ